MPSDRRQDDLPPKAAAALVRPNWLQVLRATWLALFRPRNAGRTLADASWPVFVPGFAVTLAALLAAIVAIRTYAGTFGPLWMMGSAIPTYWKAVLQHALIVIPLALLGLFVLAAMLTTSMRNGVPFGAVYACAFRAVGSLPAALALAIVGEYGCLVAYDWCDRYLWWEHVIFPPEPEVMTVLAVCAGLWCLPLWLAALVSGVSPGEDAGDRSPRCEGCGYDLTHKPASGACPECGYKIALSLTPGARRAGTPWSRRRSPVTFFVTTWDVIFHPQTSYRCLRVYESGRADCRFASWTHVLLALGAFAWAMVVILVDWTIRPPTAIRPYFYAETVPLLMAAAGMVAFGCWIGHRFSAVFALWLCAGSPALSSSRAASRIVGYEASFIWVFCAYWGVLFLTVTAFQDWLTRLTGMRGMLVPGAPVEFDAFVLGTLALGAVWLWRYRVALQAVRWANF